MRIRRFTPVVTLVAAAALLGGALPAVAAPADGPPQPPDTPSRTTTATPGLVDGLAEPADASVKADRAARAHLEDHRDRYGIADPDGTLVTASVDARDGRETVRLDQRYRGLPVLGAQYVVRMTARDGRRTVTGTSGDYYTGLRVDTSAPVLTADTAVAHAVDAVRKGLRGGSAVVAGEEWRGEGAPLSGKDAGLAVVPVGTGVLARHVVVRGTTPGTGLPVWEDVYVDAATGVELLTSSRIRTMAAPHQLRAPYTAKDTTAAAAEAGTTAPVTGEGTRIDGTTVPLQLQRDEATGTYRTVDTSRTTAGGTTVPITTLNGSGLDYYDIAYTWPYPGTGPFTSDSATLGADLTEIGAVDAHWAAGEVYDYYKDRHGRDSLDGAGMPIDSVVGITYGGLPFVNAYWDGSKMVYGTGDAEYRSMASDLDVVGHEMTHGVVEHTARLLYAGQTGALNEAFADYFGNAIDVDTTGDGMDAKDASLIGEDLCRTASREDCALRDLDDGMTTADFQHLLDDERYDLGGVHLNSTIVGGALWDIREALGGETADAIVYRALTDYLTPTSEFVDARDAVVASARSFGLKGSQLTAVTGAFDSRGVTDAWEKSLDGKDASTLLERLGTKMYVDMAPSTGGGWYAVPRAANDGLEPPAIWVGRTDGKGAARQVSADDGSTNSFAQTDGERVVWLSRSADLMHYRILSAPLTGGETSVLYETTRSLSGFSMDSGLVAWSEWNPESGYTDVNYLLGDSSEVRKVAHDWVGDATAPVVLDGKIGYIRYDMPQDGPYEWAIGAEVYDTADGTSVAAGLDPDAESVSYPAMSHTGIYWVTNLDAWRTEEGIYHDSVRAYTFATGKSELMFEEHAADAKRVDLIAASDTTLTFTEEAPVAEWNTGVLSDRIMPRLWQYTTDGTALGAASCAPGAQMFADAEPDGGRTVVFKSSATSANALAIASGGKHC
ncbi:hypothetical protein SRB5_63480 [Streptomyces sp. RB5]|uniref:Uncharacterized protein n=1 Tax=Streptomyces smaragdinus TaxID=2585196 RepID=A0A7K0CRN6_9ACTN|nr:M4 family metallopeptidase [Streptomyces smaragdinus]MQY16155.1 hypothetical protein [Streptomyces smaragdinus]